MTRPGDCESTATPPRAVVVDVDPELEPLLAALYGPTWRERIAAAYRQETLMSDRNDGRTVTLFGRVYVWARGPRGWTLRPETDDERAARADAAKHAADTARARAHAVARDDNPAALAATLASIDALEQAATR